VFATQYNHVLLDRHCATSVDFIEVGSTASEGRDSIRYFKFAFEFFVAQFVAVVIDSTRRTDSGNSAAVSFSVRSDLGDGLPAGSRVW